MSYENWRDNLDPTKTVTLKQAYNAGLQDKDVTVGEVAAFEGGGRDMLEKIILMVEAEVLKVGYIEVMWLRRRLRELVEEIDNMANTGKG